MAEPMNGDFRKLLDEQKKSNELLSSINTGQQEQGTAKEIIKQALPEIANERQLHKQRMKFEKKEGKTEVDEKVEKQVIEKLNANINIPIINEKTEEKILKAVWSTISEVLESVLTKGK